MWGYDSGEEEVDAGVRAFKTGEIVYKLGPRGGVGLGMGGLRVLSPHTKT